MSRRHRRFIPVTLVLPAEPPTQDEIDTILMAADPWTDRVGQSGRAIGMATLTLRGSRNKRALAHGWDQVPEYGALRHLTADQIASDGSTSAKVDWCIHHRWLHLEYNDDGIPLLYHTDQGWERVKALWIERILGWFEGWAEADRREPPGAPSEGRALETIDREIKLGVLADSDALRPPRSSRGPE